MEENLEERKEEKDRAEEWFGTFKILARTRRLWKIHKQNISI